MEQHGLRGASEACAALTWRRRKLEYGRLELALSEQEPLWRDLRADRDSCAAEIRWPAPRLRWHGGTPMGLDEEKNPL